MKRLLAATAILFALSPLSARAQNVDVPTVNWSAVITAGATYQLLLPATHNTTDNVRRSITFSNNNTGSDNCRIEVTGLVAVGATSTTNVTTKNGTITTYQASILLAPGGGSYGRYTVSLPSGPIVGTCDTTGDSIYADVQ